MACQPLSVFQTWLKKHFKARSTLATMSKQHSRSNIRLCRKDIISTQNSFDIVAVFGNKVERSFDIVAGVDRA